jgi:NADP-dependent 3-hydroxy acid dehydrogenase YdfG
VAEEIHAINNKIEVLVVSTDLRSEISVEALWEKVQVKFGHADVLINNAGTFSAQHPVAEYPAAVWWNDFVS